MLSIRIVAWFLLADVYNDVGEKILTVWAALAHYGIIMGLQAIYEENLWVQDVVAQEFFIFCQLSSGIGWKGGIGCSLSST